MKKLKKIFAIVLALVMVMAMAVPALATEGEPDIGPALPTHIITINQENDGHKYGAYQIFSGVIEVLKDNNENDSDNVLTEVQWGSGINSEAFLAALKTEYADIYGKAETAADVALALSNNNTSANARAFADMAGDYLTTAAGSTETRLSGTDDNGDPIYYYEIANLTPGYYLVKDEQNVEGATLTDYLLRLVNDVAINPKDGEVTVEKWILEGQSMTKVSDFVINKPFTFELHGTLPDNFERYDAFNYVFHDTMSPGLTYIGNMKVEIINGTIEKVVSSDDYEVNVYPVVDEEDVPTGETKIEVVFDDLVALNAKTDESGTDIYTIHADTKIFVSYTAILNDDAVIGAPGNPNKVYIRYSNDPNNEGTGTDITIDDEVYAFTFGLDMNKTDGQTKAALPGVGFKLYTDIIGAKEYAIIDLDPENDITDYTIVDWSTDEAKGTLLYTDANGNFTVYGLDQGTYYLKESAPLPGYNGIEDIMFEISSAYNTTTKTLTRLSISYESVNNQAGDLSTGIVDIAVVNNPGSELPSTGGVGTTLFYVFGGIMVLAAVVLLVTKKRMHN